MGNKVRWNVFNQVNHSQEKYKASYQDDVFQLSAIKETISTISDEDKIFYGINYSYPQEEIKAGIHSPKIVSKNREKIVSCAKGWELLWLDTFSSILWPQLGKNNWTWVSCIPDDWFTLL